MLLESLERILVQFRSEDGTATGEPFDLPLTTAANQLNLICNAILDTQADPIPYAFYVKDNEVTSDLRETLSSLTTKTNKAGQKLIENSEDVVDIVYAPQALFRVRPVTRCSSSLPGHTEPVISVAFNFNGTECASGSGDTTVRFWDLDTQAPRTTCRGHRNWVLCIAWSPDGLRLSSACKSGLVIVWDTKTGKQLGRDLTGHKSWVNALSWEPMHKGPECRRFASASKDTTVRIWDSSTGRADTILTGHTASVTAVKWGGSGLIYTGSQDRSIKVWRATDGTLCRSLDGHAHWINTLALNTDYAIRTAHFEPNPKSCSKYTVDSQDSNEKAKKAAARYEAARAGGEIIVSGSDDFTMIMWTPETASKPVNRLTGHQQLINDVKFSPDARLIASASFDKSIKIWHGRTGVFLTALRGHVAPVYQVAWAADSRLLVSGSADSTLKIWALVGGVDWAAAEGSRTTVKRIKVGNKKNGGDLKPGGGIGGSKVLAQDLPGHLDQVFVVDWSPDGAAVVSGGKDKVLKLWRS